jgi:hypothetical protein
VCVCVRLCVCACVCARVCVRVCVFSTGVVVGRYGGSSGLLHHLCVVSLGVVS